jgi:hypothetical protein
MSLMAAAVQSRSRQLQIEYVRHLVQRHEMKLQVLPRGEVRAAAGVLVRHARHLLHLPCRQHAAWNLRPHHLRPALALPVGAKTDPFARRKLRPPL